jgi:hypothetical protein
MTITDFSTLSLTDQLEILYTDGVHLGKRKADNLTVILYQFERWYVEIYYEKYRQKVKFLRCTDSGEILNPYLDDIEIGELLK